MSTFDSGGMQELRDRLHQLRKAKAYWGDPEAAFGLPILRGLWRATLLLAIGFIILLVFGYAADRKDTPYERASVSTIATLHEHLDRSMPGEGR